MLKRSLSLVSLGLFLLLPRAYSQSHADAPPPSPTIAEKTASAQKLPGYFNLYWDAKQGKLWPEIDKWSSEFLYQSSLPAGIGSNDIGVDRGQLGGTHIGRTPSGSLAPKLMSSSPPTKSSSSRKIPSASTSRRWQNRPTVRPLANSGWEMNIRLKFLDGARKVSLVERQVKTIPVQSSPGPTEAAKMGPLSPRGFLA